MNFNIKDLIKNSNHPYDISEKLLEIRESNRKLYIEIIKEIPNEIFADVISEMPSHIQEELSEFFTSKKLAVIASKMDTDDATDLIQNLSEHNKNIATNILDTFNKKDKDIINQLISYDENEAGAYMQTELFSAKISENIGESIQRLRYLKNNGIIDNIWHIHLTDNNGKYLKSIGLEELILFDTSLNYNEISIEKYNSYSVNHKLNIQEVVETVTNYNLTTIVVVDNNDILIGRITSDDIYDIIEDSATEQIYHLAGVDDEVENEENIFNIGQKRAYWLGLNLITAIVASVVIGFFDETLQSFVALAILMPIVASMGGNAGTQTLTVTVRQMAIGEIDNDDAKKTIKKEIIISFFNGIIFAIIMGTISYFWFDIPLLGVVIALSMIINLLSAGFFGAIIPIILQKSNIDPAIGSTVLLTTITDIVGFFSFLGLASIILI